MMKEKVIAIIRENLEQKRDVRLNSRLVEDLGIDSFSMLMIINDLEAEFSIRVDDKDFDGLKTVSDVCGKITARCPNIRSGGVLCR